MELADKLRVQEIIREHMVQIAEELGQFRKGNTVGGAAGTIGTVMANLCNVYTEPSPDSIRRFTDGVDGYMNRGKFQ